MATKALTAEAFVIAWQTSQDLAEVAKKTGVPAVRLRKRAAEYRMKGIKLKMFDHPQGFRASLDIKHLNKQARLHRKQKGRSKKAASA